MTDEITHDLATDIYTVCLDDGDGPRVCYHLKDIELRRLFLLLVSHYCEHTPEVTHGLKGLVTADNGDGIEYITEWVGAPKSAQYRGNKLVSTGKVKGARAWLNIGNYGICARDMPLDYDLEDDDTDADPEPEKDPETLDKWIGGIA